MDVISDIRAALTAACAVVREGLAADAVAGIVPAFVASPASTPEAAALLRAAFAHGLAVVPRGAGTGFGWGLPGSRCDLVVDMQAMDQVLEHAAGDLVARVQAGVTLGQLGSVLGLAGQQLALDAPLEATVGGVVATGTAGPRRFRYGAPRDLLIGITAVRADGVVAHSGGKVVKNVAGYDIGKLLAGSQGTLALITEATFRLHPVPPSVAWVTAEFGPADLPAAAAAVGAAAGSALVPSAVELDWSGSVLRMGVLLEGTAGGVADRVKQMCSLIASLGAGVSGVSGLSGGSGGSLTVAVADVPFRWWDQVPASGAPAVVARVTFWVSALAEVLDAIAACGSDAGVQPAVGGPAGAGMLYACLDPGTGPAAAARFVATLRERVAGPRGGVAVLAAPAEVLAAAQAYRDVPGAALMRAVKDQFDPGNRMFPGRMAGVI
jgi:glycolate oxidase FAD binding subunit